MALSTALHCLAETYPMAQNKCQVNDRVLRDKRVADCIPNSQVCPSRIKSVVDNVVHGQSLFECTDRKSVV